MRVNVFHVWCYVFCHVDKSCCCGFLCLQYMLSDYVCCYPVLWGWWEAGQGQSDLDWDVFPVLFRDMAHHWVRWVKFLCVGGILFGVVIECDVDGGDGCFDFQSWDGSGFKGSGYEL